MVSYIEKIMLKKDLNDIVWDEIKSVNLQLLCFGNLSKVEQSDPISIHGKTLFYLNKNSKYIDISTVALY